LKQEKKPWEISNEELFFYGYKEKIPQCPKMFRDANLETCNMIPKEFIEYGKEWAKKPVSLFLFGNVGPGKTHYAFALIREMFKYYKKIWPRYFSSTDFDKTLLEAIKSEFGDKDLIDMRKKEDLLFIDDFGRESETKRLKNQYFEIINYRYSEELPTIISSNYSLDNLSEFLDSAIASRMQQWQNIHFKGPDLRKIL
jgi:DNA replication protein DnaC